MAGITNVVENPKVEMLYVDENARTHTRYYGKDEVELSVQHMKKIEEKFPVLRQGYLNSNKFEKEGTLDISELALTAILNFGAFQCRYLLRKYESGEWFVNQPKGTRLGVIIFVERKSLDELEEERIENNFSRHKFLEDVGRKK